MGLTAVPPSSRPFKTGARPTPRYKLAAAMPFVPPAALLAPQPVAYVPAKLSMWGNDQHGDCVSAEEAFTKAAHNPEIFLPDTTVIDWARRHGVLEGADLVTVLNYMVSDGFSDGTSTYNDGPHLSVDYSNEPTLQAALNEGPVKIGIDSSALPHAAGQQQGWFDVAGQPGQYRNLDHCVALAGFGTAQYLYGALGLPTPGGLSPTTAGYLLFTWSSLGFVTHNWIMSTCGEAWVRNPPTVIVGPGPTPTPPPGPGPVPPPGPTPGPGPAPLFTLTVRRPVRRGQMMAFRAPVAIPAGVYSWVPAAGALASWGEAVPIQLPPPPGAYGAGWLGNWTQWVQWIEQVIHAYGPFAEPYIDQAIDASGLPDLMKSALKQLVHALIHGGSGPLLGTTTAQGRLVYAGVVGGLEDSPNMGKPPDGF